MSNTRAMRWLMTATVMLTALSLSEAQADTYHFKDVLRPHGHERSTVTKYADGRFCGASVGHFFSNVTAIESCMRSRDWVVDGYTPDQPVARVAVRPARRGRTGRSTYIDPDTGLSCQNFGGIAVCGPPQGTVRYYDSKHGLNCQRTGLVAICSNF